jgi:hypothetical protein
MQLRCPKCGGASAYQQEVQRGNRFYDFNPNDEASLKPDLIPDHLQVPGQMYAAPIMEKVAFCSTCPGQIQLQRVTNAHAQFLDSQRSLQEKAAQDQQRREAAEYAATHPPCPYCATEVKLGAAICPQCRSPFFGFDLELLAMVIRDNPSLATSPNKDELLPLVDVAKGERDIRQAREKQELEAREATQRA